MSRRIWISYEDKTSVVDSGYGTVRVPDVPTVIVLTIPKACFGVPRCHFDVLHKMARASRVAGLIGYADLPAQLLLETPSQRNDNIATL